MTSWNTLKFIATFVMVPRTLPITAISQWLTGEKIQRQVHSWETWESDSSRPSLTALLPKLLLFSLSFFSPWLTVRLAPGLKTFSISLSIFLPLRKHLPI